MGGPSTLEPLAEAMGLMQHHDAVIGQHVVHLVKELGVVQPPDMLEHAD